MKHTWKDPCGGGLGSVWHRGATSSLHSLSLPTATGATGNEDLMVPQWEQILKKCWQSWPSSPTWFWQATSFPFHACDEITPLYKLQPPSTSPTQSEERQGLVQDSSVSGAGQTNEEKLISKQQVLLTVWGTLKSEMWQICFHVTCHTSIVGLPLFTRGIQSFASSPQSVLNSVLISLLHIPPHFLILNC